MWIFFRASVPLCVVIALMVALSSDYRALSGADAASRGCNDLCGGLHERRHVLFLLRLAVAARIGSDRCTPDERRKRSALCAS
jgi:hypothetical protein